MTERPLGPDTTSIDEPAPAADAAGAGSTSSGTDGAAPTPVSPTRGQDLGRALVCAVLVAGCVASPELLPLVAPFVPVLVALRLLRRGGERRAFLVSASSAAVVAAVLAARVDAAVAAALAMALLLVPALGWVHARAARRDPVVAGNQPTWPEPRIGTGLTPTIAAWLVATVVVVLLAVPAFDDPRDAATDRVHDQYERYLDEWCTEDGAFADQEELCDRLVDQRDAVLEVVEEHGVELLGALAAAFAFGAATTAHLVVLWRARRSGLAVRPPWRLRELEVHWGAAYLVAAGLAAWLLADLVGGPGDAWLRAAALAVGGVGAQLVVAQGLGLATWSLTRGRRPAWYWVMLGFVVLLTLTFVPVALFALGVLDLALHPRRRAAAVAR